MASVEGVIAGVAGFEVRGAADPVERREAKSNERRADARSGVVGVYTDQVEYRCACGLVSAAFRHGAARGCESSR